MGLFVNLSVGLSGLVGLFGGLSMNTKSKLRALAALSGKSVIVRNHHYGHDVHGLLGHNGDYVVISGTNVSFHWQTIKSIDRNVIHL